MKTITASPGIVLSLGREGENAVRQIIFNITDWHSEFGKDGVVALLAQRPGETEPYPAAVTVSGPTVTWLVSAADTAKSGVYGQAELQYRIGDVVVKSAIWRTFIADSLGAPSPTPPDPQQSWVDQVLEAAAQAEQSASSAETSADKAATAVINGPKIQTGTWWVWDFNGNTYVDTGVQAKGPEGPQGPSPTPVYINMQSEYGVDVVAAVFQAISQGQTDVSIPFPSANSFLSRISTAVLNGKTVWLIFPLSAIGDSSPYCAQISGMTIYDGKDVYWVDTKISVYNNGGWLSGYLGIDRSTVYVKITEAPGL